MSTLVARPEPVQVDLAPAALVMTCFGSVTEAREVAAWLRGR